MVYERLNVKDNAEIELQNLVTSTAVKILVTEEDISKLPAFPFVATLNSRDVSGKITKFEKIKVTGREGTSLVVERGYSETAPLSFSAGDCLSCFIVEEHIQTLQDKVEDLDQQKQDKFNFSDVSISSLKDGPKTVPANGEFLRWDEESGSFITKGLDDSDVPQPFYLTRDTNYILGEDVSFGDLLFVENTQSQPLQNASITDNALTSYSRGENRTDATGCRVTTKKNIVIKSITKEGGCTATRCIIGSSSGAILATANFSGNTATFDIPYYVASGETLRIVMDANGATYYSKYYSGGGITGVNLDYIIASSLTADLAGGGPSRNITNIVSEEVMANASKNIGDVAGNKRLSIKGIGSGVSYNNISLILKKKNNPQNGYIRIETDDNGSPSGELVDPNAQATIAYGSIFTELIKHTTTFEGSFTIPKGQVAHIVIGVGTYGNEVVDALNYYSIGISTVDTSIVTSKKFDGTTWTANYNFMTPYISDLFLSDLLSKANAQFTYKTDIVGMSDGTYSIGEKQGLIQLIKGNIIKLNGVVSGLQYLSNTPGKISNTPGTNIIEVGDVVNDGHIHITYKTLLHKTTPSNNAKISAPTERTTTSTGYVLVKSFITNFSGRARISAELRSSSNGRTAYSTYKINGINIIENANYNGAYTQYYIDTMIKKGDIIDIFYRAENSSYGGYLKNAFIGYDIIKDTPINNPVILD